MCASLNTAYCISRVCLGLITQTKKDRSKRLRALIRLQRKSSTKIQALWRRAFIRSIYTQPSRDYWIQCYDEEQGPEPYYYNTMTLTTNWKVPLAYKYFVSRYYKPKKEKVLIDEPSVHDWIDLEENGVMYSYNIKTKEYKAKE